MPGKRQGRSRTLIVEARIDPSGFKVRDMLLYGSTALVVLMLPLAPALFLDGYLRVLTTVLFVGLCLVVLRAYAAALLSFGNAPDPPKKPVDAPWPTVSVLVPAYNEADVLPRTMGAMKAVDYPEDRIEFVYVYEASSQDETARIVRGFAEANPRFKAVRRDGDTGGKGAAANTGLAHCTGEFVVSLDADHRLKPDAVKRAARWFFEDPRLACVRGRCVGENGDDSFLARQVRVERDAAERGYIYLREVLDGFTTFGGGQAIFRRCVFEEVGLFDEEILVEDIDYSMRLHEAGWRVRIDPGIITFEESPATLQAWWAQRKRWARGWMQVATRYLPRLHKMENLTWRMRADAYYSLVFALISLIFALFLPLVVLAAFGMDTTGYIPSGIAWMWTGFALAPITLATSVLIQDLRDGVPHAWKEAPAFVTLWVYIILQTPVLWAAFLEEFVFDRPSVYVKTPRNGASAYPK